MFQTSEVDGCMQAEENKRLAMELEKQKILERKNQVHSEIDSLLQVDK